MALSRYRHYVASVICNSGGIKSKPRTAGLGREVHFLKRGLSPFTHPRTFIVIGLLRSPLDPAEVVKQQQLF
jgi:hypothetical protein